jgi:hypothetical protein
MMGRTKPMSVFASILTVRLSESLDFDPEPGDEEEGGAQKVVRKQRAGTAETVETDGVGLEPA